MFHSLKSKRTDDEEDKIPVKQEEHEETLDNRLAIKDLRNILFNQMKALRNILAK